MTLNAISTTYILYWHIGRLGILFLFLINISDENIRNNYIEQYTNYLKKLIDNNPNVFYPLLDINHIELYLIFVIYLTGEHKKELFDFFLELGNFLCIRRIGNAGIPFIESRNRIDLVAEYVATKEKPIEWNNKSSYLLTMLLEMFTIFDKNDAEELINYYFNEIITESCQNNKTDKINLVSWYPNENWQDEIFKQQVTNGTGINTSNFSYFGNNNYSKLDIIEQFMNNLRKRDLNISLFTRPVYAYILACLKNQSPLPPEFWRVLILGSKD